MGEMIPGQNKDLKSTPSADTNLAPTFAFGIAKADGYMLKVIHHWARSTSANAGDRKDWSRSKHSLIYLTNN